MTSRYRVRRNLPVEISRDRVEWRKHRMQKAITCDLVSLESSFVILQHDGFFIRAAARYVKLLPPESHL